MMSEQPDKFIVSPVSRNGSYPTGDESYFAELSQAEAYAVEMSWDEDVWGIWTNDDDAELVALVYQQIVCTP